MHIHKLRKTTSGSGYGVSLRASKPHPFQKRTSGSGLVPEIFSNNKVSKSSEVLRNLKISKPRVPKKYISFE